MNKNLYILCCGQFITQFGSMLTSFGIAVWMITHTDSIVDYALGMVFLTLPGALLAPFLARWLDRLSGKTVIVGCDILAACCSLLVLALLHDNDLTPAWIYLIGGIYSVVSVLKYSILSVVVAQLVPNKLLSRANGTVSIFTGVVHLVSPAVAGTLYVIIGLNGLVCIDLLAFVIGLIALVPVRIVSSRTDKKIQDTPKGSLKPVVEWLVEKPQFAVLFLYLLLEKFVVGMVMVLVNPVFIALYDERILGTVLTVSALGGICASIVMSLRAVNNLLLYILVFDGLVGLTVMLVGALTWLPAIYLTCFAMIFSAVVVQTCERTLWQTIIPSPIRGRFFAVSAGLAMAISPVAAITGAVLADRIFEPNLAVGGDWSNILGPIFGLGEGRGIGVMFSLFGLLYVSITVIYFITGYLPKKYQTDEPCYQ